MLCCYPSLQETSAKEVASYSSLLLNSMYAGDQGRKFVSKLENHIDHETGVTKLWDPPSSIFISARSTNFGLPSKKNKLTIKVTFIGDQRLTLNKSGANVICLVNFDSMFVVFLGRSFMLESYVLCVLTWSFSVSHNLFLSLSLFQLFFILLTASNPSSFTFFCFDWHESGRWNIALSCSLIKMKIGCFKAVIQLFSWWLAVVVCFAAYVSTRNFTCLREITFFLIGWTLVERWRNLTVAWFFERQQQNSANRKDGDPHRHVTGTCRHVIEKHCRTDNQYENSCMYEDTSSHLWNLFHKIMTESKPLKAGVKLLNVIDSTSWFSPTTSLFFSNEAKINNILNQQCCTIWP